MKKHGNHGEERDDFMARLKAQCDAKKQPYPPELEQHLDRQARARDGS